METPSMTSVAVPIPATRQPWGLHWRSSIWFSTLVVGLGICTDGLVYSVIVPVIPFRLQVLGYQGVSKLVGWLLFAFSAGIVFSTFPIAYFSEKYQSRRGPYMIGMILLIGSQIMFMEAPTYWLMVIARVLQGCSSSIAWVIGLALITEVVREEDIGKQLGFAMIGMTVGILLGAPIGGTLYDRYGFRGPILFGIITTVVDLLGRFLIIERHDALKYGYDPQGPPKTVALATSHSTQPINDDAKATDNTRKGTASRLESNLEEKASGPERHGESVAASPPPLPVAGVPVAVHAEVVTEQVAVVDEEAVKAPNASLWRATILMGKSSRAMVAFIIAFIVGIALTSLEPALPLRMQAVWGYDAYKVGLVSLAAVVPTVFSTPIAGWYSDKAGPELAIFLCMIFAIPWFILMVIPKSVVLFIFSNAAVSFFISATLAPITADLAAVGHATPGVGFAHIYGAFNIAFGLGSAVGPLVGGQVYDNLRHGWAAICYIGAGLFAVMAGFSFFVAGVDPLYRKVQRWIHPPQANQNV